MNFEEMKAGPELDAIVAERVMGWKRLDCSAVSRPDELYPPEINPSVSPPSRREDYELRDGWALAVPQYTTDLNAAAEVIARLCVMGYRVETESFDDKHAVTIRRRSGRIPRAETFGYSLPFLICLAALRATRSASAPPALPSPAPSPASKGD